MIDRWIATLHEELELTAEEIADITWLALIQHRAAQGSRATSNSQDQVESGAGFSTDDMVDRAGDLDSRSSQSTASTSTQSAQDQHQDQQSRFQAGVLPRRRSKSRQVSRQGSLQSGGTGSPAAMPIKIKSAPALRDPLSLIRALRPLILQVPTGRNAGLDENATVQKIADERIWLPIMQPVVEPWLELALIIDESPSMLIWQRTVWELQRLFKHYGAFRDVRTWGMVAVAHSTGDVSADSQDELAEPQSTSERQIYLRPEFGGRLTQQSLRRPEELIDPKGRRLVLVVTDCVSGPWREGSVISPLSVWAEHGPVAIVQMLPDWLWVRTALRQTAPTTFYGLKPGLANQQLSVNRSELMLNHSGSHQVTEVYVPVITLEPDSLHVWSQVVAGKGGYDAPGVIFTPTLQTAWEQVSRRRQEKQEVVESLLSKTEIAEQRVQRFKSASTPMARVLASLVAATPVIQLPVIRLIQELLLPASRQVHVAEVLLGNLLTPTTLPELGIPPDEVIYQFVEPQQEIRACLLEDAPVPDTTQVLSNYVIRYLGKASLDVFLAEIQAQLSDPSVSDGADVKPFAIVAAQVLKRRGRQYADFVRAVEERYHIDSGDVPRATIPEFKTLEFETAQLVPDVTEEPEPDDNLPVLQTTEVEVVTIEILREPPPQPEIEFGSFTFEVATLERGGFLRRWTVRKQQRQAQRYIERLGNRVTLMMVVIPGGTFVMGSPENEPERSNKEGPQHDVLVNSFLMSRYPITQQQWRIVAAMPQQERELNPDPSSFKGDKRPVENVSWYDAQEFCARLSAHTGREYGLPTEAEWEYACRAGTTTPFHFGETISPEVANYNSKVNYNDGPKGQSHSQTTSVDEYKYANAFGLCDMHGNVWEWCEDHYHDSYEGAPTDGSAWIDEDAEENELRVLRGGSWYYFPRRCRSAYRYFSNPRATYNNIGFRVVCRLPRSLP